MERQLLTSVASGMDFSLFLDCLGYVWGVGSNFFGELSVLGNKECYIVPTQIPGLENIISVSCGPLHSACLDNDGNVWTFGKSIHHGLGHEDISLQTPHRVEGLSNIVSVACGDHTLCLDSSGIVFGLGLFGINEIYQVPMPANISYISCGVSCSICLDYNDNIFIFRTNTRRLTPFKLERGNKPLMIPRISGKIIKVAYQSNQLRILDEDGNIWGTGEEPLCDEKYFDSSIINKSTQITDVAILSCGVSHTLLVDKSGRLWTCGGNTQGQLGMETKSKSIDFRTMKQMVETKQVTQLENITHVSNGGYHTYCKDKEGKIWCFGKNSHGQLCIGDDFYRVFNPKLVPEQYWHLFWPVPVSRVKSARK